MAKDLNKNYSVYKHTLPTNISKKENDMVYIGITSINPDNRWRNGLGYYNNKYFYSAIKKYGWNNFKHEVLFEDMTKEEAELKEVELIARYNSSNRLYGYNIQLGGNSVGKHSREIKDKIGISHSKQIMCVETMEMYKSIKDAISVTGLFSIKKHLCGELDYAGVLEDGTKLHWLYCPNDMCGVYSVKSSAISKFNVSVNGVVKNTHELSLDDLIILFNDFIVKNNRIPLMRECTLDNNLPQQRIVSEILSNNSVSYNDFINSFGKTKHVRSKKENYGFYVEKFINESKNIGRPLTQKELKSNCLGLPSFSFFVKNCPSNSVSSYSDFIKWCGLVPPVKYFDKNMVGKKLVDLENNLKRPLKVSDITCENCGFSYQMVKKYFKNLTGAKKYIGLM